MNNFDLSQNYFQIFNLRQNFSIDLETLTASFQTLQSSYHPDKFVAQNDINSRQAMQVSSLINEAYQALKNPIKRAIYIMQLNGVNLDTETDTNMDIDFLMEQMELRETMDAIPLDESGLDQIDGIALTVKKQLKQMMERVESLFEKQAWSEARALLREVQFMNKIDQEAKKIQESIEDTLY
jgi:molecular chaperone HscB